MGLVPPLKEGCSSSAGVHTGGGDCSVTWNPGPQREGASLAIPDSNGIQCQTAGAVLLQVGSPSGCGRSPVRAFPYSALSAHWDQGPSNNATGPASGGVGLHRQAVVHSGPP
jgi:hypothetical protein